MTRVIPFSLWGRLAACGGLAVRLAGVQAGYQPAARCQPVLHFLRSLFLLCLLARFAPAQTQACQSIAADQVLGKHLAAALPAFANLPPDLLLAPLPPPGSKRIFHAAELATIARRYGFPTGNLPDICFEWQTAPLDRAAVAASMRQSLDLPDARLEIADMLVSPVPPGELDFPRDWLSSPAGRDPHAPVLWRGDVIYGDNHRLPVWARVRIMARCNRITAAHNLKAGEPLVAAQLRQTAAECFPVPDTINLTIQQIVGSSLRHPVSAGTEIVPDLLMGIKEVNRGDAVEIEVFSGAAHLKFTGKAETDGNTGDIIAIRNLSSNRIFHARVTGKGKATVQADAFRDTAIEPKD